MRTLRLSLLALVCFAVVASLPVVTPGKGGPKKEKGSYKDWNHSLIDELEIVEPFQLSDYQRLVILPLDTEKTPLPEKKDNTYEPVLQVLGRVSDIFLTGVSTGLAGRLNATLEKEPPTAETASGVLLLRGTVTQMNPGSRAARYWVGFGAGKSRVEIQAALVNATTGATLLKLTHAKASGIGVGGGDYNKFLTDDTNDLGEDIGKMLACF